MKRFAILADETIDCEIMNNYQCPLDGLTTHGINDDFIGIIHVPSTTASTLMKDTLICCALPLAQCRG